MKTKSLAMLAVAGLLTASFAYATPAMSEDMTNEMPMEQTMTDSGASPAQAPGGDGSTQNQATGNGQGDTGNSNGGASQGATGNSEEGSPDTATGDDDY